MDHVADDFAARLGEELGADAWFEEHFHRTIWYATLVHFAAAIENPQALVSWVTHRRDVPLGDALFDGADVVRFDHAGHHPVRVRLAGAAFGGHPWSEDAYSPTHATADEAIAIRLATTSAPGDSTVDIG